MKTRCGPRLPRRPRRPAPLPATRTQIRQKVEQIRACYQIEAILELSQMDPNVERIPRPSSTISGRWRSSGVFRSSLNTPTRSQGLKHVGLVSVICCGMPGAAASR